jgi:hypothetical protein
MHTVLIDASSAILLFKGGLFEAVAEAYRLTAAGPVGDELTGGGYPGARTFAAALADGRLARIEAAELPAHPPLRGPSAGLHPGERATLAAMAAGRGDFVIIDDGAGARFCRRHAIPYINALLCPRILKLAGRLSAPAAAAHMDRIRRQGRYAPAIVAFAYDCEDAILEPFLPDVSQALSRGFYSNGPGGQKGRMW